MKDLPAVLPVHIQRMNKTNSYTSDTVCCYPAVTGRPSVHLAVDVLRPTRVDGLVLLGSECARTLQAIFLSSCHDLLNAKELWS